MTGIGMLNWYAAPAVMLTLKKKALTCVRAFLISH